MSGFVKAGFSFLKNLGKGQKTTGTEVINKVTPNVPVTKGEKTSRDLKLATQKRKASEARLDNTLFRINQQSERLKKKLTENKAKGGRVGLKRGTGLMKKQSNVEKIKKTFGPKRGLGMQSVIYGLDKNPKITKADPKAKFIAAANKKKNKKVI
jgi:hypothetical protein